MAKYRITGPDGGTYEVNAPDDATEDQVLSYVQQNAAGEARGRTFAQPKLTAQEPSVAGDVAQQFVLGVNRGLNSLLSLPGAIVGGAVNMLVPGEGDRFKWDNAASRTFTRPDLTPQTDAGRYADAIGQNVGGSAIPMMGIAGKTARGVDIAANAVPASSTIANVGRDMVNRYAASPGRAIAADAVASTGAGVGQQLAEDLDFGPTGQLVGGLVGGVAPFAASAAASRLADGVSRSPTVARYRTQPSAPDEAMPQSAGAAVNPTLPPGDPARPVIGPEAAAYQHLANRLSEAKVKPGELGQRLERSDVDSVAGPSALGLVDLDPSLQRLAGSVVRQSMDGSNRGQRFVAGRQTGITPLEGMPDNSGIPTRQFMEPGNAIDPPAGQFERMRENVRSALNVPPRSAYRTDQDLVMTQKTLSQQNYGEAYTAANGVNIAPVIDGVLSKWSAIANDPGQLRPIAKVIEKAVNTFTTKAGTVSDLERFQTAKELLDEMISGYLKSPVGRNRRLGGELNKFKNELLQAVDSIDDIGPKYQNARGVFGSVAEMRSALDSGRSALKEGAEVSADAYRNMSPGEQQMFRVGLADATERIMAAQKRGADVTQIFQKPAVQELFMEVSPQDQATRLGRNIQTENTMTRTNNEVFGNSKTQQRQADDEAFNQMGDAIEALRNTRSATDAGFKVVKSIIERVAGFRGDTASELAAKLFTADRAELDTIIRQIEARLGPSRAEHFRSMITRYSASLARQQAASAATVQQPQQQPPPPPVNRLMRPDNYLPPDPKPPGYVSTTQPQPKPRTP